MVAIVSRVRIVLGLGHGPDLGPKPVLLRFRSSETFIIWVVCIAWFTDMFLYGIIVPVLPMALTERIGIPYADRQYWVSVLLAVFGTAQMFCALLFGYISDRVANRKPIMYIGLISLALSTILLCVGRSIAVFVVGRALQGASAAMVGSVALALICDTVSKQNIGRAMGFVTIGTGVATVFAPVLGGLVYDRAGYTSVFAMAFGFIGLDLILRLVMIEKRDALRWETQRDIELPAQGPVTDANKPPGDLNDIVTSSNAVVVSEANPSTTSDVPAFILLSSPAFLAALWGTCVLGSLLTALDSTLPIYTSDTFGFNALGGGATLFAFLTPTLGGPLAGALSDKYGRKYLAVLGFIIAVPFIVLLRLVDCHSIKQIILLCALLFILGCAITISMSPLMSEIAIGGLSLEGGRGNALAQAFGLSTCAFSAGCVIGPVWGGLVLAHLGWGTMTWTLSLLPVTAVVISAVYVSSDVIQEE